MMQELQTRRLLLRPLKLEDAEQAQLLFSHWEIVKFLNARVPWPYPPDGAFTYFRDVALPGMEQGTDWYWTMRLQQAPEQLIGLISMHASETVNRGFWLGLRWQGQGFMSEAIVATNDYWFDVLGFAVLRVHKAIANGESRRISQKTGMRVVGTHEADYVSGRHLSETWESTAAQWRAWKLKPQAESDR